MNRVKKVLSNPALCQELDKSSWLWTPPGASRKKYESHDFAGYGSYDVKTTPSVSEIQSIDHSFHEKEQGEKKLGELEATAISGNGTCCVMSVSILHFCFFMTRISTCAHIRSHLSWLPFSFLVSIDILSSTFYVSVCLYKLCY